MIKRLQKAYNYVILLSYLYGDLTYENGLTVLICFCKGVFVLKIKPVEEIKALCEKYAAPLGITVADVEFKQGKNPALTVFIDKTGGVSLDDCEKLHNAIFEPLDELDPTFGLAYTLNVSSLGADRPFKTDKDFENNLNLDVEVKLYSSVMGKKFHEGKLIYFDDKVIRIKTGNNTLTFDRKSIVKINKAIKFD